MTPDDLARLAELEQAATPGPWWPNLPDDAALGWEVLTYGGTGTTPRLIGDFSPKDDAAFIAAIRNAAPSLIAEAREAARLREALDLAEEYREAVIAYLDPENQYTDSRLMAVKRTGDAFRAALTDSRPAEDDYPERLARADAFAQGLVAGMNAQSDSRSAEEERAKIKPFTSMRAAIYDPETGIETEVEP